MELFERGQVRSWVASPAESQRAVIPTKLCCLEVWIITNTSTIMTHGTNHSYSLLPLELLICLIVAVSISQEDPLPDDKKDKRIRIHGSLVISLSTVQYWSSLARHWFSSLD